MRAKTLAACLAFGALSFGWAAAARAQKPADPHKGQEHQKMMQGLTDAAFVPLMIKHHQHAVEMSREEETRGASAAVKQFAVKIRTAQEAELVELKAHLAHVGAKSPATAEHEKMMEQEGQVTMKRLKAASGAALDHAFLEEMVTHHQSAIDMASGANLQNAKLKKMASKMAVVQRQEVAEIKKLLSAHSGK